MLLRRLGTTWAAVAITVAPLAAACTSSGPVTAGASQPSASSAGPSSTPGSSAGSPRSSSASSASATTTAGPSGSASLRTIAPRAARTSVAALGSAADSGGNVDVDVVGTTRFTARATAPGDISGPAVAFTVEVRNGSRQSVSLAAVTVTVTYGSQDTPAASIQTSRSHPFTGDLPAGRSTRGTYVFGIPRAARSAVRVSVTLSARRTVVTLVGPIR